MNYIKHLQAFYHHVRQDDRLSPNHISLYLALFQYWNYNRFQNRFSIDRDELMKLSKIGSKGTYYKCIKDLHTFQYIFYHAGIQKFQSARITMARLEIKNAEKADAQLNLFNVGQKATDLSNEDPKEDENSGFQSGNFEQAPAPEIDTATSTDFDTSTCTGFETQPCPENGTVRVPVLDPIGTENGTVSVPKMDPYIKHKHLNGKQCVVKTRTNTHEIIFEKNKNLSKGIAKIAGVTSGKKEEKRNACRGPNLVPAGAKNLVSIPVPIAVTLSEVETYFREHNYSPPEAKKFFYYNEGRAWLFADNFPVRNWRPLVHKWMLNNFKTKFVQNDRPGNPHTRVIDTGSGKDYSEPL